MRLRTFRFPRTWNAVRWEPCIHFRPWAIGYHIVGYLAVRVPSGFFTAPSLGAQALKLKGKNWMGAQVTIEIRTDTRYGWLMTVYTSISAVRDDHIVNSVFSPLFLCVHPDAESMRTLFLFGEVVCVCHQFSIGHHLRD